MCDRDAGGDIMLPHVSASGVKLIVLNGSLKEKTAHNWEPGDTSTASLEPV